MIMPDPSEMDTMEPMPNQNTSIFKKPVTYIVAAVVALWHISFGDVRRSPTPRKELNLNE